MNWLGLGVKWRVVTNGSMKFGGSSSSIGPLWIMRQGVPQSAGLLYLPYALEVPACTPRRPHVYNDATDL
jgi:hypothetical protein